MSPGLEILKTDWSWIHDPTLMLDMKTVRSNIAFMAEKAKKNKLRFRPHFKTHQSKAIGGWFREAGVKSIAVSSVEMASYFASGGWDDITIAFPFNPRSIGEVNDLASRIHLGLLVSDNIGLTLLSQEIRSKARVWIEIDVGDGRSGFAWSNVNGILAAAEHIANHGLLQFGGLLAHAGHSYLARGRSEVQNVHDRCMEKLSLLRSALQGSGLDKFEISVGDTPTCSLAEGFSVVSEIRPGNFVFYDLMQETIGACSFDQIAVAMACPVVAVYPERNQAVIHGGGVHFSKDALNDNEMGKIYGRIVNPVGNSWSEPLPGCYLESLSQEHGIVRLSSEVVSQTRPGDLIWVLPVHSCMTADLMRRLFASDEEGNVMEISMMKAEVTRTSD